jgi:hypothetical protein
MQSQVDCLVDRFVDEASDWKMLASFMAGSLAYRMGRIGVLSSFVGAFGGTSVRLASIAGGLGSEVAVFEWVNRSLISFEERAGLKPAPTENLWNWCGPGGLKQALLNDLLAFGILKGAGALTRESNLVFQQVLASTAMVVGHQTAAALKLIPRPEGSFAEQFFHAVVLNLQMTAGTELAHGLVPALTPLERGLDLSLQFPPMIGAEFSLSFMDVPLTQKGPSTNFIQGRAERSPILPFRYYSQSTEKGGARDLREKYRPFFPPETHETFSDAIVGRALATPSKMPHFHERLLEAYAQVPEAIRGTREQLFTVHAIQRIFEYDPLRTGTGSFENALLQFFIESALRDSNPSRRSVALQDLFQLMERGNFNRNGLYRLFGRHGYGNNLGTSLSKEISNEWLERHAEEIQKHLHDYRPEDQAQWIHFIFTFYGQDIALSKKVIEIIGKSLISGRYDPWDIKVALDFAKSHPLGQLVLLRILQVFAIEDHPAKLKELRPETVSDTALVVSSAIALGFKPEKIAKRLNGTRHTGYVFDLRLARKMVSVFNEITPYLSQPELRKENERSLNEGILGFLSSGKVLGVSEFRTLLWIDSEKQLGLEFPKDLKIEILPAKEFDRRVRDWGEVDQCDIAFLGRSVGPPFDRQVFLKEMPPVDLSSHEGLYRAFREATLRLMAMVHEGEHWRHFTGRFEGLEEGSEPLVISKTSRHERLVSEMMANLEEQRWTIRNLDQANYEVARRLGENLPLLYRSMNEHAYFHRVNQRLATVLSKPFLKKIFSPFRGIP